MDTDQNTEKTTQSQPLGQSDVSGNASGGVSLQKQLATTSLIVRFTGPLGLASFSVSKGSALKVAVVGTVVWLVLLEIFFVGIWPSL